MFWKSKDETPREGDTETKMTGMAGKWRIFRRGKWSAWHEERTFADAVHAAARAQNKK